MELVSWGAAAETASFVLPIVAVVVTIAVVHRAVEGCGFCGPGRTGPSEGSPNTTITHFQATLSNNTDKLQTKTRSEFLKISGLDAYHVSTATISQSETMSHLWIDQ